MHMEKSWEKTVEWHFASEALNNLDIVSPLDGTREISDLIANVGSMKWVLVEFKHNEDSLKHEDQKYPLKDNLAMHSVLRGYFRFENGFPPDAKNKTNINLLDLFVAQIEANNQLNGYLMQAQGNVAARLGALNGGPGASSLTKVQNNLTALLTFNKNPIGEIKSNALALLERYEKRSQNSSSIVGAYAGTASVTFYSLPPEEPHLIVFGEIGKKGKQKLRLMRYWDYTIQKGALRDSKISNLSARWRYLKKDAGVSREKFLEYLNTLSLARGYLPNVSSVDNDRFGYFSAIGIYKRRGVVVTGTLVDIPVLVNSVVNDLMKCKVKKTIIEKIIEFFKSLPGYILHRLNSILGSKDKIPA